ncbi:MAG TPA: type II secretion system protein [Chthoniobacteraceae bacterium]|jgi:prepilin-type N-terminal cleavage/methylation domain-containing protein
MTSSPSFLPRQRLSGGFTIMELLVVVAIILVLAAITLPVISSVRMRGNKAVALNNMRQLAGALLTYASQNDATLPAEDSIGTDTWGNAANPENQKAWYNCLPRLLGGKGVGDFAADPRGYYTSDNLLFLPGATYPDNDKRLVAPLFAIAINTKLQRKNEAGMKEPVKLSQITVPQRTVMFLEQGIRGEAKASPTQPKYDGTCKGSAKSFVARYSGQGVLTFMDGHAEAFEAKDLLTETGKIIYNGPGQPVDVIWCRTPEEDPNKSL